MAVELRRLGAGDRPRLAAAVDAARTAGEFRASSDPEAKYFLQAGDFDPSIIGGAFDRDDLVGFVSGEFKLVVVRPDRRRQGIGRQLVDLALEIEASRGREAVILGRLPNDEVALAFFRATGFEFHSTLWDLDLPRDVELPEPTWPDGLRMRSFDRTRDVEQWVALFNAAFADHATPLQFTEALIIASFEDPTIVDEDTGVIEEIGSGELVAFCATGPTRHDGAIGPKGEIWTVGVRPGRQGQGLGRELLRWGARRLRSIGVTEVSLSVNSRNERALSLYEREGFIRSHTRERWSRSVEPVG